MAALSAIRSWSICPRSTVGYSCAPVRCLSTPTACTDSVALGSKVRNYERLLSFGVAVFYYFPPRVVYWTFLSFPIHSPVACPCCFLNAPSRRDILGRLLGSSNAVLLSQNRCMYPTYHIVSRHIFAMISLMSNKMNQPVFSHVLALGTLLIALALTILRLCQDYYCQPVLTFDQRVHGAFGVYLSYVVFGNSCVDC